MCCSAGYCASRKGKIRRSTPGFSCASCLSSSKLAISPSLASVSLSKLICTSGMLYLTALVRLPSPHRSYTLQLCLSIVCVTPSLKRRQPGAVNVHSLAGYQKLKTVQPWDHFSRFSLNANERRFFPETLKVFCTCNIPYNPGMLPRQLLNLLLLLPIRRAFFFTVLRRLVHGGVYKLPRVVPSRVRWRRS
jgi:hypothetical protein